MRAVGPATSDPDTGGIDAVSSRSKGTTRRRLDAILVLLICGGTVGVAWVFDSGHPDAFARPKTALLRTLLVVALLVVAIRFARHGTYGLVWYPALDVAVAVFALFQVAAYAFSVDRAQSFVGEPLQLQGLVTVLSYLASFYLARLVFGEASSVSWLFSAVAGGGLGVAIYALAQRADLDPVWDQLLMGRVFSSLGQPNALGAYLVLVIAVSVGLWWDGPPALRLLGAAAAALSIPAVALTRSRGAFLGLATALGLVALPLLWARRSRWRSMAPIAASGMLAAVLVLVVVAPLRREATDVWDRAATAVDLDSWDAIQRLALWEVGWAIALDHPLVGAGQETYPLLFPEYRDRVLDRYRAATFTPFRPESPHNQYVGLAAGSGFVSLATYLAALGIGLTVISRTIAATTGRQRVLLVAIAAAIAAHVVTDAFMTPETTGSFLFWVMFGAGIALAGSRLAGTDIASSRWPDPDPPSQAGAGI